MEGKMLTKLKQKEHAFEYFMLLFIALQPILDLLTSMSINLLHINTTIGIFARFGVMALVGVYILMKWKQPGTMKFIIYLVLLGITFIAGLANNMMVKEPFSFGEEAKFIMKCVYTTIMLFGYILVFQALRDKKDTYGKMLTYFLYAALIFSVSMIVAWITGTDYKSYPHSKLGSRGWFYAGNELSGILAIIFPLVVLYAIHKTTTFRQAYYWIPTILTIFASMMIGTKVGYGAVVITLGIALVFCLVEYFMNKKDAKKKSIFLVNAVLTFAVLAGVAATSPITPVVKNTSIHLEMYEYKKAVRDEEARKAGRPVEEEKKKDGELTAGEMKSLVYSDRNIFLQVHKDYYAEAPMSQKLLGMGYASNYEKEPKMIEMDFLDLFFSYGIIGFIVFLLPFIYYTIRLIIRVFKNFKTILTVKYMMLASSLALALGIAATAGHVLTAPNVGIYFMCIFAYVVVDLKAD
jgi:O-antigen ligase like membrane protein